MHCSLYEYKAYELSKDVIVYGVGSPLLVDYEESLARANFKICQAIENVPSKNWLNPGPAIFKPEDIKPSFLELPFLVPIFTPGYRQFAALEATAIGFKHPLDLVDRTATIPRILKAHGGLYINAGCTIGAGCEFEEFVSINRSASIGHHVYVERFASIGPGVVIGGMVRVNKGAFIGGGAIILPKVTIGENSIVGAGAVVTRDVPAHTLVLGSPAKVIKENIPGYQNQTVK